MTGRIEIKRGATKIIAINPLQNSAYTRSVMGENEVTLSWELNQYVELKIGDTLLHDTVLYRLNELPVVKKQSKHLWRYDAKFQSPIYELSKLQFMLFDSTNTLPQGEFDLTGEPQAFVNLLVQNLNRIVPGGWTVGSVVSGEVKTLSFSNENCYNVLSRLATEFETEFSLTDKAVNLDKIADISNLTLEYGTTLYDIERKTIANNDVITRIYPFGSERNLPVDYRNGAKRLMLPAPDSKLEKNVDKFGVIELVKNFDEIYPRIKAGEGKAGTITSVTDMYQFVDSNLDFDINDYLLPGTEAKVKFLTGLCAGYECVIKRYSNSDQTIEIIPNEDDPAFPIPQSAIKPAVGDTYVLLDIAMPSSYIANAEAELALKANEWLDQNSVPKVSYVVTFSSLYAKEHAIDIKPGDMVQVIDTDMGIDANLRAVKVTQGVRDSYELQIELSDTVVSKGTLTQIADDIAANKKETLLAKKGTSQAFARSWREVQELAGMIETLQTEMLVVGDVSGQFSIRNTLFTANYSNDKNKFYATAGFLDHNQIPEDNPGSWTLPAYAPTQTQLNSNSTAYYLYAVCSKTGSTGNYQFSADKKAYDSDSTNWYFLIGVLSSVNDKGIRIFQTTYGFTQISGRNIATGIIQSADGKTYFDLDNGVIGGHIKFRSTGGGESDLEEVLDQLGADIDSKRSIDSVVNYYLTHANKTGITHNTSGWSTTPVAPTANKPYLWNYEIINYTIGDPGKTSPVIIGYFAKDGKDGKDGYSPYIGENGNWYVWDAGQNKYVDSGDPAQGDDGHSPEIRDGYWWVWENGTWSDTGVKAEGEDGKDGYSPYIGENGNWYVWDVAQNKYVDSGEPAQGDDGHSPEIRDGYWWVWENGAWSNTGVKAEGEDGKDGYSPYIGENGNWYVWDAGQNKYVDSGDPVQGDDGHSPEIRDGYWWVWENGAWSNTGVKAEGEDGKDGYSPYIGENGNWYVWDAGQNKYVDSGDPAQGDDGHSPEIRDGYWWVWENGTWSNTGVKAEGDDGVGVSGIEEYYIATNSTSEPAKNAAWVKSPPNTIPVMTSSSRFLWNYEVVKYSDGSSSADNEDGYNPRLIGAFGVKGDTGAGIASVSFQYRLSTSATTVSGGSWSATMPDFDDTKYLWIRDKYIMTNNSTIYSEAYISIEWMRLLNLELGVVNLLPKQSYKIDAAGSNFRYVNLLSLLPNKEYIFTVEEVVFVTGSSSEFSLVVWNNTKQTGEVNIHHTIMPGQRNKLQFKTPDTPDELLLFLYAGRAGQTFGNIVQYNDVMLLQGNIAPGGYVEYDYLKAAILNYDSEVEGGLVLAQVLGARDEQNVVRSYMNGMAGNPTAFAAGVSDFGTAQETKNVDVRHDGSAKFGDLFLYPDGKIELASKNGAKVLNITKYGLPQLADAVSSNSNNINFTSSSPLSNYHDFSEHNGIFLTGISLVSQPFQLTEMSRVILSFTSSHGSSGVSGVDIYKSFIIRIYNEFGFEITKTKSGGGTLNVDEVVPLGTYRVHVQAITSISPQAISSGVIIVGLSWGTNTYQQVVNHTTLSYDGLMSILNENRYFYLSQSSAGAFFAMRGLIDIPAGLGGGSMMSSGGGINLWGKVTAAGRSGSTVTINHGIGDLKYTVQVALNGNSTWYYQNKGANSIQIVCSGAFDFVLIRTPY